MGRRAASENVYFIASRRALFRSRLTVEALVLPRSAYPAIKAFVRF
jgi:hypothetical protein